MTEIAARHLAIELAGRRIVHDLSVDVEPGSFVGLVGPNGSGKTTLLRALHRNLRPVGGTVLLGPDDLWTLPARDVAKHVAVVAQEQAVSFGFTASEVAAMGRTPHKRSFQSDDDDDRTLVIESLDALGLAHLAHRPFNAMSGGERQRTLIARALVQQSTVLLLDEPTNHLDIHYQLDILHRVRALGLTTVAALHDLNLASATCDRIHVIQDGRIVSSGPPAEALDPDLVSRVFAVRAVAFTHPITGAHQLLFDRLDTTDG